MLCVRSSLGTAVTWKDDGTDTSRGDDRVPGTNLTREEAQQRAKLLTVDSYEIDLDLSGAQEGGTYRSVTTVRFDVAGGGTSRSSEAETGGGAESFIDLVAPAVH